jgi:hypothetical protein
MSLRPRLRRLSPEILGNAAAGVALFLIVVWACLGVGPATGV